MWVSYYINFEFMSICHIVIEQCVPRYILSGLSNMYIEFYFDKPVYMC